MPKKSLCENEDWLAFAAAVKDEFARCDFQEALIEACGGAEDLAWAAFFHHGRETRRWLESAVPFLGNRTPAELIRRGRGDRVRECLWRTP